MFLKKWQVTVLIVSILVLSGIALLIKTDTINLKNNSEVSTDSLSIIESLTPEIQSFSLEIKDDPQNPSLYYARGNAYFDAENLKYALIDFYKAYRLDSTNASFALGLSDCLFFCEKVDSAIIILENYLQIDPNNEDVLITLAIDYYKIPKSGNYLKSQELLEKVTKINIQNPEAYFYKGMIAKEMKDTINAIRKFQTAIEVDPDYFEGYMQLGNLYAKLKDSICIKYYKNALQIEPDNKFPAYGIAKFYQDIGKMDAAITEYKEMISKNPQDDNAIYNLATIYYGIDSIQTAYRLYELAIRQAPAKAMSYYGKGMCAEELEKRDEAISLYTQALNLDPDLTDAEERLQQLNAD